MFNVKESNSLLHIEVPYPNLKYLNNLSRKNCFIDLWKLFRFAHSPLKEMTESYSAYKYLKQFKYTNIPVIHIGDGASCLTGALFAFLTKQNNISIDPNINENRVDKWVNELDVEKFTYFKSKIENIDLNSEILYDLIPNKCILTFVHSHVNTLKVLEIFESAGIDVIAIYASGCCMLKEQLSLDVPIQEDWSVLSEQRKFQIWIK